MTTWSIRFRGSDERDTLGKADYFFLENKEAIGLTREEFFARIVSNEDGTEAAFVSTGEPLWNLRPGSGGLGERPVGVEPAVGVGPRQAEEGWVGVELSSEGEEGWVGAELPGDRTEEGFAEREVRASGPEPAQEEDAL